MHSLRLVSIHVLAERTKALNASRYTGANDHNQSHPSQLKHMLNFCEGMQGLCRNALWLQPMETENAVYRKDFLSFGKKEQDQKNIL